MEENMPIVARRVWDIMRIAILMVRKGLISKKKLLLDLNLMMKRGKLAGKALTNFIFHHHNHRGTTTHGGSHLQYATTDLREFEFSCSNTPLYRHYFTTKRKHNHQKEYKKIMMPLSFAEYEDMIDISSMEAVNKVLDMNMMVSNDVVFPGLGSGPSPRPVRQLRITDSPFPYQGPGEDNHYVDQAADEFIKRFYSELKQQI